MNTTLKPLTAIRGVLAARGAASVVMGVLVYLWPDVAVAVVVRVFAAYLMFDGLAALWSASRTAPAALARAPSVIQGTLELAGGALALAFPDRAATLVAVGVGVWAVAVGALVLCTAVLYWRRIPWPGPLVLGGLLVAALGSLLAAQPDAALAGADGVLGLIAATAGLAGALLLLAAGSLHLAARTSPTA